MSVVFLLDKESNILTFDAVTQVEVSRTAALTKNTVQSGKVLTDNYHSEKPIISFSGLVTSSKLRNIAPTPEVFIRLMDKLIDTKEVFTLYGDGVIPDFDKCFITSFSYVKGLSNLDSLECAIAIQQVDIGEKAKLDVIAPTKATGGQLASTSDTGTGSKTEASTTTVDGFALTQLALRERSL